MCFCATPATVDANARNCTLNSEIQRFSTTTRQQLEPLITTMAVIKALAFLLLSGTALVASTEQCIDCAAPTECSLYLAPSSIEGAGLGIYTAKNISKGDYIGEPDRFVPVLDKFKTLPYRGQQQFLSWLGYVWPAEPDFFYSASTDSFPTIPDG